MFIILIDNEDESNEEIRIRIVKMVSGPFRGEVGDRKDILFPEPDRYTF